METSYSNSESEDSDSESESLGVTKSGQLELELREELRELGGEVISTSQSFLRRRSGGGGDLGVTIRNSETQIRYLCVSGDCARKCGDITHCINQQKVCLFSPYPVRCHNPKTHQYTHTSCRNQ